MNRFRIISEDENPASIRVFYIDDDGSVIPIKQSIEKIEILLDANKINTAHFTIRASVDIDLEVKSDVYFGAEDLKIGKLKKRKN